MMKFRSEGKIMYDPKTVAHEIKSPFRGKPSRFFPKGYRKPLITIWHVDPERDGTDDSCGWFIRGRHLSASDQALAARLITHEHDNLRDWFSGCDEEESIARIRAIFAALRRHERPWWRHPRWHFWHWQIQVHPWHALRRWAFTRCAHCGERFAYGASPISHQWHRSPAPWFGGEQGLYHEHCSQIVWESEKAQQEKSDANQKVH
jgi:hypothetical protein